MTISAIILSITISVVISMIVSVALSIKCLRFTRDLNYQLFDIVSEKCGVTAYDIEKAIKRIKQERAKKK